MHVPDLRMAIQQGAACSPRVVPEKPHGFRLLLITKLWQCRQRLDRAKKKCQRSARRVCFLCFTFWPCYAACRILVPRAGIEPVPHAVEAWSLKHLTTREVPGECLCIRELSKTILKLAGGILLLTTERMITYSYRWMKSSPHWSLLDKVLLAYSIFWEASKSNTAVFCSSDSLLTWWPSIQSLIVGSCWWWPAIDY